uniref:ABC transporter permease n=1 Tax=Sorangium cellulosum TaxID=56 RepID=A0A0M4KLR1_SORCE|nr:ABC transporter permease [Sorangium cellulosum]
MIVFKLAWRSLFRNGRRTLVTLSSIALGLAFALFFVSMVAGIHKKTIGDATRMLAGHLTIEHPDYRESLSSSLFVPSVSGVVRAAALPEVERAKVLVVGQAMLSSASGAVGATFLGVEPEAERATSPLARSIKAGRYIEATDERGVVVGAQLAERLKLDPGKKLVLTTMSVQGEMAEELLRVTGVFELGSEELDGALVQLPLDVARRIVGLTGDQATQVGLVLKDPDAEERVRALVKGPIEAQGAAVRPWQEVLPELSAWQSLSGYVNRVLVGIILFLVTFTILNTVLMSVLERNREFAMLLALGTPTRLLRMQVLAEAALLSLAGCLVGAAIGGALSYLTQVRGIDLGGMIDQAPTVGGFAFDTRLRTELTFAQVKWLSAALVAMTMLINIYPVLRSTRIDVANTLRSR